MFIILSVSDSDKHREKVVEEYTKRLGKWIKIINIKPTRYGNIQQMIQSDTQNIMTHLKKYSEFKKFLLSKEWKSVTTMELHKLCINKNIIFIIGWPYGLDEQMLKTSIDDKISFGAITLPHGLAKVILLEQLYRVETIEQWKSYHY